MRKSTGALRRRISLAFGVSAVVGASILMAGAACGTDPLQSGATQSASVESATRQAGAGSPSTDQERFRAALGQFTSGTFTITYRMSQLTPPSDASGDDTGTSSGDATSPDANDFSFDGSITLYQDGPQRSRVDLELDTQGVPTSLTTIRTASVTAFCIKDPGVFALVLLFPAPTCLDDENFPELSKGVGAGDTLISELSSDDAVTATSTRVVNGSDAVCFETKPAGGTSALYCFDDRDVMVYARAEGEDGSSGEFTAERVTQGVPADIFELPYPRLEPYTLEVQNDTDVSIFVDGNSGSDFYDGRAEIEPHSSGVLRTGLRGTPLSIYIGADSDPQWDWSCSWEDAKAHEPLIVKDESANCPSTKAASPTPPPRGTAQALGTGIASSITLPEPTPTVRR